jgi:hypothetical protein
MYTEDGSELHLSVQPDVFQLFAVTASNSFI